jgi:uncharacterized RDD family membrane protein YckC
MSASTPIEGQQYAGQRLGLPETGSGSVAGWGRRIAALFIDWVASACVMGLVTGRVPFGSDFNAALPYVVFVPEIVVFTALVGGSFGQVALRMAVVRVDRTPVTLLHALLRTVLICLVIPPVVFNRDSRGLHDLAVGTVVVRR